MKPLDGFTPNKEWFKAKRKERNLSIKEVAKQLRRSESTLRSYEYTGTMDLADALRYIQLLGYGVRITIVDKDKKGI